MVNKPLISVVLPVYNCELYIKEAVMSVLNQTIQDFEIIVIDDCSTDKTVKIIEDIADIRIRIINKEVNKGLIDSLNIGFAESRAKYIARMDGDDINELDRFEKQLHVLQSNEQINACGCWLQIYNSTNNIIKHSQNHDEIQAELLLSNPMSLGATMLEKKAFKKFQFDANMLYVEDYDFWARAAWDCQYYNIQKVLYHYRVHAEQVSTKFKKIQLQGDIRIKLSLFKKLNYSETLFDDKFLIKLLFSNDSISGKELVQFRNWKKVLLKQNIDKNIFNQDALKNVLLKIESNLMNTIFFTNQRKGITYNIRKSLFRVLSVKWKSEILVRKIRERIKFLAKK